MNRRQRKKYRCVAHLCAHNKTYDDPVPYCGYYIHRIYFICARQPQYTHHFDDELEKCSFEICEKCKSFTLSRNTMRLAQEWKKEYRLMIRHYDKEEI